MTVLGHIFLMYRPRMTVVVVAWLMVSRNSRKQRCPCIQPLQKVKQKEYICHTNAVEYLFSM